MHQRYYKKFKKGDTATWDDLDPIIQQLPTITNDEDTAEFNRDCVIVVRY